MGEAVGSSNNIFVKHIGVVFLYTYQADSLRQLSRRLYRLHLGYILNAYIITHPESEGSLHMPLNASLLQEQYLGRISTNLAENL